ncbi:MAG: sugar kinase, partial [Cohnella sp.]|nr:sugar kinase [Cohnella sp.]
LIPLCDVFLPGDEEAEFLAGVMSEEAYGARFLAMGPKVVVIKLGEKGSIGFTGDKVVRAKPYTVKRVVDTVGAGDAFAAGLLSGLVEFGPLEDGDNLARALERANHMGAIATQFKGDWEGLPKREELLRLIAGGKEVTR